HSEAVAIETREKVTAQAARELLAASPGVEVVDDRKPGGYPTPVTHASGKDAVYVGRIREDISHPRGLNLWIVSDNIRKGAALNAVQLAELVLAGGWNIAERARGRLEARSCARHVDSCPPCFERRPRSVSGPSARSGLVMIRGGRRYTRHLIDLAACLFGRRGEAASKRLAAHARRQ